ncbi:MAG: hypothetical protein ACOC9T_02040 [Myxococcota bacterium]
MIYEADLVMTLWGQAAHLAAAPYLDDTLCGRHVWRRLAENVRWDGDPGPSFVRTTLEPFGAAEREAREPRVLREHWLCEQCRRSLETRLAKLELSEVEA